jgi:hypothetical protein
MGVLRERNAVSSAPQKQPAQETGVPHEADHYTFQANLLKGRHPDLRNIVPCSKPGEYSGHARRFERYRRRRVQMCKTYIHHACL